MQPFVLDMDPTFEHPVQCEVAGTGKAQIVEFTATFARADKDGIAKLMAENKTDADLVRAQLRGWRGVQRKDGSTVEFTPETLNAMLKVHGMDQVMVRSFLEGNSVATRKNS